MLKQATIIGLAVVGAVAAATVANAADLQRAPIYTKAPPPVPVFSWTGLYIGANIGGAWSNGSITDNVTGAQLNSNSSGFIGGGQIGYNYQFNTFVLGVEWDIDGTSINKTSNAVAVVLPGGAAANLQASASTDWISTLTARFGFAVDRFLIYGKAGGAWVQNSATLTNLTNGASASASNTNSGWTAGVGAEWAFAPQWSAKLEYDHIELDNFSPSTNSVIVNDRLTLSRNIDMVKAGVNYRFNWGGGY
jgi:outer membrane immunogenic protein